MIKPDWAVAVLGFDSVISVSYMKELSTLNG